MNNKLLSWLKKDIGSARKPKPPSPLARKIRRVFGYLCLLLLALFALWRIQLYRSVSSRFASIRTAGFPVSGEELNHWLPAVPDAQNGALVMTQAFNLARTLPDARSNEVDKVDFLRRTNLWSPHDCGLVGEYVLTNAPALAKAHEACGFSRFRYPVDYSYGPETELPHLSKLKALGRIAALQTVLDAEEGRTNEWPDQVQLQLRVAAMLDGEPCLMSHLVRNALIRMAARATEQSLNRTNVGDDASTRLQAAFARLEATNLLPFVLVGARAMHIPLFRLSWKELQSFGQDDEQSNQPRKPQRYSGKATPVLWLSGFFERDLDFYLRTMERAILLAASPPPKSLVLTNYLDAASAEAQKRYFMMSDMLLLSLTRVAVGDATTLAQMEEAATALAVERFRNAQGRLPNNLKELAPQFLEAVPTDPFDGVALRYRRLARGYVIYSVDADGHDDGGRERPEPRKSGDKSSYDITFTVER